MVMYLPITSGRIILRKVEYGDADLFFTLLNDKDVVRNIGRGRSATKDKNKVIQEARQLYRDDRFGPLAICDSGSGRMVGFCGLTQSDYNDGKDIEVICALHKDFRRCGFGTEALEQLVRWGFHLTDRSRLIAIICDKNEIAMRFAEEFGFEYFAKRNELLGGTSSIYVLDRMTE